MKLLLTSAGLTTPALEEKFLELAGSPASALSIAYIDTASKAESDPSFTGHVIQNLHQLGITTITRVDIAEPRATWESTLRHANVIWIEGGNTFYLLHHLRASGLLTDLKTILADKLYVGVSAGSIIVTPTITIAQVEPADPNTVGLTDLAALQWVDFEISPHTPDIVPISNVQTYAAQISNTLYAYDDHTALVYLNGQLEIVGDGCLIFN